MGHDSRPSRFRLPLLILAGLFVAFCSVIAAAVVVFLPDRPVADIAPGSSSGPTFVVQVIRPRAGLPLGGLLPPELFGLEGHLGFDSDSPGAAVVRVEPGRLELRADDWELVLVHDADGQVSAGTEVVFELVFEERIRRVRCRPDDPAGGGIEITVLAESGALSGRFQFDLVHCVDADTGKPIGWPPSPLLLHGSFDQLPLSGGDAPR